MPSTGFICIQQQLFLFVNYSFNCEHPGKFKGGAMSLADRVKQKEWSLGSRKRKPLKERVFANSPSAGGRALKMAGTLKPRNIVGIAKR